MTDSTRIAFVYQAATAGGVERVFLNRGEALLRRYPDLAIDAYFYQDWGGAAPFAQYLRERQLAPRFRLVTQFEPSLYTAVFPVDTPQVLIEHPSLAPRIFFECHTPYRENRAYLQEWQSRLDTLIVPSKEFAAVIEGEFPALAGKLAIVRNFVPHRAPLESAPVLPEWKGPLFLHFGRIDTNKNVTELLEALSRMPVRADGPPLAILCGQIDPGFDLRGTIARKSGNTRVLVLPPVPFARGQALLEMLRRRRGVLVSCSKGESFGLSVAEAMTAGLPVILSDIPTHAALVDGRTRFLYPLGDIARLTERLTAAIEDYDRFSAECTELARNVSEEAFLEDWQRLAGTGRAAIV